VVVEDSAEGGGPVVVPEGQFLKGGALVGGGLRDLVGVRDGLCGGKGAALGDEVAGLVDGLGGEAA
jgi:hypothetical protein